MPMPLSSDKLHLTMTKSSTFSGLRDALLAVTTFPAAENTLSDFELAAGTGKTILTRCERSVKYTLQLSWFTLPKTRPEPDPEPGLLTITRPEPDPKSKSATRQALLLCEPASNGANVQLLLLEKAEGDLARHGGVIGVLLHPGSLPRLHSGNVGNNLLSGQHWLTTTELKLCTQAIANLKENF